MTLEGKEEVFRLEDERHAQGGTQDTTHQRELKGKAPRQCKALYPLGGCVVLGETMSSTGIGGDKDMELSTVKIGRRGRVVVPVALRGDFKVGDALVVFRNGNQVVFRKASEVRQLVLPRARQVSAKQHSNAEKKPSRPRPAKPGMKVVKKAAAAAKVAQGQSRSQSKGRSKKQGKAKKARASGRSSGVGAVALRRDKFGRFMRAR